MAGGISEVGFGLAVATVKLTPARTWACISFDAWLRRAVLIKTAESSGSRTQTFPFTNENTRFSYENAKLQAIETAHVNKRKQAFTNQHPVGDDVSTFTRCAAARLHSASASGLASGQDEMEQRAQHAGNRIAWSFALPAALARRVGKHDARAFLGHRLRAGGGGPQGRRQGGRLPPHKSPLLVPKIRTPRLRGVQRSLSERSLTTKAY